PANTNGSSRQPSCHAGTAVSASRAAVYVQTSGPSAADVAVAAAPRRWKRPSAAVAADTPMAGPYPASVQEPMLIGELGFNMRSMLAKRAGRPRSWIRAAAETPIAPV